MTTLAQIKQALDAIAEKAQENHKIFQNAVPKTKDERQLETIRFHLNCLEIFQNTPRDYEVLSRIIGDSDKDIESFIESLPTETTEQADAKINARIFLKKVLNGIKERTSTLNQAVRNLNTNMERFTSEQYQLHTDTTAYTNIIKSIEKESLPPAPEHSKNTALNALYDKMRLAFEQMKRMSVGDEALRVGHNHKNAISLLETSLQQYKAYEQQYSKLLIAQQEAEENVRAATVELEELSRKFKEITERFPKGTPLLELPKKTSFDVTIPDISYVDRTNFIYSNIKRHSQTIREMTEQMEEKYRVDVQTAQVGIEQKAVDIGHKLTEMNYLLSNYSKFLSEGLQESLSEKYLAIQSKNNEIFQASERSGDLISLKGKEKEIIDLMSSVSKLEQEVTSKITQNMGEQCSKSRGKLEQQIVQLRGAMHQEYYADYLDALNKIQLPSPPREQSISALDEYLNTLAQTRAQVDKIDKAYKTVKSSVELLLDGINKGKGAEFLQTTLSLEGLKVSEVLHKAAQQSSPKEIVALINQVEFGKLSIPAVKGIKEFIKDAGSIDEQALRTIREKINCYERIQSLEDKEKYMPLIDNSKFREALSFLRDKEIPTGEAVVLADTAEKRELILALKEHCNTNTVESNALTADEIKGVLSSPARIQAAAAVFNNLRFSVDQKDKDEIYRLLVREIASSEQFAQAVLKIQDNAQLFKPMFLLCLAKFDPRYTFQDKAKEFLITGLNSAHSADYQKLLSHFIQTNTTPQLEGSLNLLKVQAELQMSKLQTLQNNPIAIKKLAIVFEKVDELFTPLINQATDPALERRLQKTKKEIFDTFISTPSWDDAVKKSAERVQDNLKDDRGILQKVLDGFKRVIERISNWWNNIEEPQKPEPVDAKQTSLRFKAEMGKLKDDDVSNEVNYNAHM